MGSRKSGRDSKGIQGVERCSAGVVTVTETVRDRINPVVRSHSWSVARVGRNQTLRILA
jgi:hypothetical protein